MDRRHELYVGHIHQHWGNKAPVYQLGVHPGRNVALEEAIIDKEVTRNRSQSIDYFEDGGTTKDAELRAHVLAVYAKMSEN